MSSYRVISLTKGFVAVIDAADYRRVNKYSWHMHKSRGNERNPGEPYARATINGKKVYLHRFILDAPQDSHVDHKNHCTLDCRRENLEIVCVSENMKRRRNKLKSFTDMPAWPKKGTFIMDGKKYKLVAGEPFIICL